MGKTGITGRQIRDDTIESEDIKDGDVKRDDLNTTEAGQAVIRKAIAGINVTITETGEDAGTGDVTINATSGDITAIDGGSASSTYDSFDVDGGGA